MDPIDPTTSTPTPPKKFTTRAGIQRKTKEEREQYAKEEAERNKTRQPAPVSSLATRGQAGTRNRSHAVVPASDRVRSEGTGSVFGAAVPVGSKPRDRKSAFADEEEKLARNVGESVNTKETASLSASTAYFANDHNIPGKKTVTRKKAGQPGKQGVVDVDSGDSVDEEPKRDIETIWISSEDEIPIKKDKGKKTALKPLRNGAGLRPVRAPRDAKEMQEIAMSSRNRVIRSKDKAGDTVSQGIMITDEMDTDPKDEPLISSDLRAKSAKKRSGRTKEVKASETVEERAERLRFEDETIRLREELSLLDPISKKKLNDHENMNTDEDVGDPRTGRLYLFQFPPYTPYLDEPAAHIEIKDEPETDLQPSTSTMGLLQSSDVKKEELEELKPTFQQRPDLLTAEGERLPSGLVGKMRVHKSGKVTLDWGGTAMEVRSGTEVDFLQDAVLTGGGEGQDARAWALGQVRKKMVVIPDWQKIYD